MQAWLRLQGVVVVVVVVVAVVAVVAAVVVVVVVVVEVAAAAVVVVVFGRKGLGFRTLRLRLSTLAAFQRAGSACGPSCGYCV